ncbi:uncharacterized protein [Centruroides vittatus]|uniref:uncharacterized protein n=1 Tax=Centruroides vittatus TaxID=120091 RepID=UPI00350FDFF0
MNKNLKVLDGGLGTELSKFGQTVDDHPLWSAYCLFQHRDQILNVHKSYLRSGADILTSASYQADIEGFKKYLNLTTDRAEELIMESVRICRQASEEVMKEERVSSKNSPTLVAGSVGPYAVHFADGSEYTGNYIDNITCEELMEWHRPRFKCLIQAECDILALETIPAEKEGIALLKLLKEFPGTKAWLSFCCQDPHLTAHKEELSKVIENCLRIAPPDQLVAVGVNCCPPSYVESLLHDIGHLPPNVVRIAYPNSGEEWESKKGWTKQAEETPLSSYVPKWMSLGGCWLGGCCRTTPDDIKDISKIVHSY